MNTPMDWARKILPPLAVMVVVVAVWWMLVVKSESPIFPTPWQVVTGALELAQDGTLWEHIGASLFRVGVGFGLAFLVAIPLGLWMGWVGGAYRTFNPIFQMLRPISPIACARSGRASGRRPGRRAGARPRYPRPRCVRW